MKYTGKLRLTLAGVLMAGVAFGAAVAQAAPIKIVMSDDSAKVSLKGQTFEKFAEEIKNRLGDKVVVELHHSSTLFDQSDQVQGVQLNAVNFIAPTTGTYASLAKGMNAFNLPFLLDTPEKFSAAMKDETIRHMFVPALEAKNVEPVAFWINGPRVLGYTGTKAVLTPADIAGMKIRVQSAPVYVKTFAAVDANPVSVNWGEAPTALQTGVIDGAEVTPNAWKGSGMYEMIDHLTLTNHMYSYYMVGTSKSWWDGLPDDVRTGISDALKAATEWNIENGLKMNSDDVEFMRQKGVEIHTLDDAQHAQWVSKMKPVWKELGEPLVGKEVMTRLKEIAGVAD
jgi:C4-dicarboxylate-binding protein DctP